MKNILLVDDEKFIRKGIKTIIERMNFQFENIFECANGLEGLEFLKNSTIDLVIADIKMPGMNGIELMKETRKLGLDSCFIILSGYEDFVYARDSMRYGAKEYLLKPVHRDELKSALLKVEGELKAREKIQQEITDIKSMAKKLSENEFNYIIINEKIANDEIKKLFYSLKPEIITMNELYIALLTQCKSIGEDKTNKNLYIHTDIKDFMDKYGKEYWHFNDVKGNHVLFTSLKYDYTSLIEKLNSRNCGEWYIGISNSFRIENVRIAYLQAEEALKSRIIRYPDNIICFSDLEGLESFEIPFETVKKIGEMTGTKRMQEVNKLINSIFSINSSVKFNIGYYESLIAAVNNDIIDYINRCVPQKCKSDYDNYASLRSIYNYVNIQDYVLDLKNFIWEMENYLDTLKSEYKERSVIDVAINYIRENYQNESLSMTIVANYVSLNYSYFSFLFKKHTNTSFIKYLKNLRIEKAIELLRSTEYKINEVAVKVGYQNPKHFTRIFRQETGISPLEYFKKIKTNHSSSRY